MIDHVLGRPSAKSRRLQVLAVISFWTFYLFKGHKHGPPGAHTISRILTKSLTAWQTVVATFLYIYAARNFSTLVGLSSPEPMSNMYDATFFRATWVLTALDAGFWTAMKIRSRRLRDLASIIFSVFYLVAAEKADEKVRKVRSMITVDHLRVSWNKGKSPYLNFFQGLMRPRFTRWPARAIRIPRPPESDYKEPISAWLYYDGPLSDLEHHTKIVLDIPGGGYVAMDPRCNDDKLFCWAAKTGLPILALDYKKAPEFPYPYAVNECFDVYCTLVKTKGRCIGLSGRSVPRIVITGDSAGGNLAAATTLMIIERSKNPMNRNIALIDLPIPDGLVLFYPSLDMNIGNWMSEEQMSLIRDRQFRKRNKSIMRRKARQYTDIALTPHHSDNEDEEPPKRDSDEGRSQQPVQMPTELRSPEAARGPHPEYSHGGPLSLTNGSSKPSTAGGQEGGSSHRPQLMHTRLAVSSMISYFNDRVITPEMMRAMIILYIGPHNRPDFSSDYLLSPVLAPDALVAHFPKTWFLTGERDPLVDDTVIFAGRLTKVKEAVAEQNASDLGIPKPKFDEKEAAEVILIPGISHGFLQFPTLYPPAWKHLERSAAWIQDLFIHADRVRRREHLQRQQAAAVTEQRSRHHFRQESSGDEDRPLEIAMTKMRVRSPPKTRAAVNGTDDGSELGARKDNGRGRGKKPGRRGGRGSTSGSLVKLNSEEDLLGRRMKGLTNGLAGMDDDE
ncbi:hypothetical protein jhhlp_001058 [Lomentospora prolificans]|uniref:Alpha/beta hydrolase fold-3 domain-containing protein n=1 Tax=Lomentospora prolificans TaxID=41688 RepID=A0A2N3NH55_9PEZI|nr:hypothetical protein jhhlp_001058 [Lomentospora prolificans]